MSKDSVTNILEQAAFLLHICEIILMLDMLM